MPNKKRVFFLVIATLLIFSACGKDRKTNENPAGSADTNDSKVVEPNVSMRDYFPPDGSKGHFTGEGNEMAEFNFQVTHVEENYVVVFETNETMRLRRIFKIETDRIDLVDSKMVGLDDSFPTLDELNAMNPVEIYLQKPLSEGTVFGDWTVIQTGVTIETPFQQFENAVVIEKKDKDVVDRKFFVSGYGEVKRETAMSTEDGSISANVSVLESLGK